MYWPARRKKFGRFAMKKKNVPLHGGANIDFKVVKINSYGKRQKRTLRCSSSGVSNLSGKGTKWFVKAEDIYSVKKIKENSSTFILTALHRFKFECEEENQVERIIEAFNSLNLGKFPKKKYNHTKSVPRSLETTFSFVDEFKTKPESFNYLSVIGKGSYGKVYQVQHKITKNIYAMKVLVKGELYERKQVDHTRTEQLILSTISHPFIVTLHYSFQTQHKLFLVLDFVKGGELFFHLRRAGRGRFPESLAMFYNAEIILAIEYLHKRNIVYRDLKPENVLLNEDGHIKLTDFGLAKSGVSFSGGGGNKYSSDDDDDDESNEKEDQKTNTFCGTPAYFAPEVLKRDSYGKSVDYWTIGILIYEMLTGKPPFIAENRNKMFVAILNKEPIYPTYLSEDATDLIKGFLQKNPLNRLGSKGFDEIKKHNFFKKIDWKKLSIKKIAPPFKPIVQKDPNDISCFDSNLTNQVIENDEEDFKENTHSILAKNAFPGFYFERVNVLKQNMKNDLETLYLGQSSDEDSDSYEDIFELDNEILKEVKQNQNQNQNNLKMDNNVNFIKNENNN
ncbi:non-specific serine/threonine protein kinase [Anaeramoeba flamelloides]|uniref:Non-specific serine/threonine protein kinase n=1 Tax=Anaeramoeba flamelloides TaxID=1746091 RepID=A0AAV7Y5X6_9EUKA|nr:non-specific serine/threonine protein kinase [Anaeramoeba flamelloides]